jgi:hypothetical protein
MSRSIGTVAILLGAMVLLVLLFPAGRALSRDVQEVLVNNFPSLQRISGTVSVEGTILHAVQQKFPETVVATVRPEETHRLVPAGTLLADGFTSVVLGVSGQFKSVVSGSGTIGVILIPEDDPVLRAFYEAGKIQFPLEVKAVTAANQSAHFASESEKFTLAFPRYRVYFYNTSESTVGVYLHAYLTN